MADVVIKTEKRIYRREIHNQELLNDIDRYSGKIGAGIGLLEAKFDEFNGHCYGNSIARIEKSLKDLTHVFTEFMDEVKAFEKSTITVQILEEE